MGNPRRAGVPQRSDAERHAPRRQKSQEVRASRSGARLAVESLESRLFLSTVNFAPQVDYVTGNNPRKVVTADFDGDGSPDVASANYYDYSVSVLLNDGDGKFAAAAEYNIVPLPSSLPVDLVAADFNGDGKPDMAVVDATERLAVLLNDGDGTFTRTGGFATGLGSRAIAAADFDGDGNLDLATADYGFNATDGHGVSILLGNGDGTFRPRREVNVGTRPVDLVVGDFDVDGKADVAVAVGGAQALKILLGNGDGTFAAGWSYTVESSGTLETADLNGDARPDLMLTLYTVGRTHVFLNGTADAAAGTFAASHYAVGDFGDKGATAADVDADGKLDLVIVDDGNYVSILPGNGDGTFRQPRVEFGVGYYARSAAPADFDGDGRTDLVIGNAIYDAVSVLLNRTAAPSGAFEPKVDYRLPSRVWGIESADLDGDGGADLVAAYDRKVAVLKGRGDGTFAAAVEYTAGQSNRAVHAADFNGDGKPDLAVGDWTFDSGVGILLNNGDGTFKAAKFYATGRNPSDITSGDFNGDGELDLAVANNNSARLTSTMSVLLGNGDGTFGAKTDYVAGHHPSGVVSGDFNHDGKTDLALSVANSNQPDGILSVFLGNGDGTFGPKTDYVTGGGAIAVAGGDFNHDGRIDLAVSNASGNSVSVFRGNGDGTFAARTDYAVRVYPYDLKVADLNGDGQLDLATADYDDHSVSVLHGAGDGTFARPAPFAVGPNPFGLVVSDFDRDGRTDVATGNYANGTASVLLNSGPRALNITGTAANDGWYLKRVGDELHLWNNATGTGPAVSQHAVGAALTLNGLDGDDTLTVDVSGGDVNLASLSITGADGADKVRLVNAQDGTLTLGAVPTLNGGRLDLERGALKLTGVAPATVEALLASARDGATPWQGPGIGTSAATDNTGLVAVAQGADTLVRYSYNADANGDGKINADDYFRIDQSFLAQPQNPLYNHGDFNFDDRVNADDYFLIDSAFLGQGQALANDDDARVKTGQVTVAAAQAVSAELQQRTVRRRPVRPFFSDHPVRVVSTAGRPKGESTEKR